MKLFWHLWQQVTFCPEGVGTGSAPGGETGVSPGSEQDGPGTADNSGAAPKGGSDAPDLVKAASEGGSDGDQGSQKDGGAKPAGAGQAYWPDGLPETLQGLKGASDQETIDKLTGQLKDAAQAPAKPDDYKLDLPEAFTKHYGDLSDDQVLPIWRQVAHKNGLSDAQFNGAISELYAELSEKGMLDEPIDIEVEFEKLMPKHGDMLSRKAEASRRINGVASSIDGLVGREVLTKAEGNIILALAARSEGVVALEKMFKALDVQGLQPGGGRDGGQQQSEHEKQMRSMFPSMHKQG